MNERDFRGIFFLFLLIVIFWGSIVAFFIDLLKTLLWGLVVVVVVAAIIAGIFWFGENEGWW
jgi:hypothetical protein